jgi:hypothetical protein
LVFFLKEKKADYVWSTNKIGYVYFYILKKFEFFLKINNFLVFSDHFDELISKIIFLKIKKKHHFDAFLSKKHFEKQP